MDIPLNFIKQIVTIYCKENATVHITDRFSKILFSTDEKRTSTISKTASYVLQIHHPVLIDNQSVDSRVSGTGNSSMTYGVPILYSEDLQGAVIVRGKDGSAADIESTGNDIKAALESVLLFQRYTNEVKPQFDAGDKNDYIARLMISNDPPLEKLISLMNERELDVSLQRCVIAIDLHYSQNYYFNINLNLGYQSSHEQLKNEIIQTLRECKYLNSQDIITFYGTNTILVIKSFISSSLQPKLYLSVRKICAQILEDVKRFATVNFTIAFGNIIDRVENVHRSFEQANSILRLFPHAGMGNKVVSIKDILFETIADQIDDQITSKLVDPAIEELRKKDHSIDLKLIECMNAYVDSCMNLTVASEKIQLHRNTLKARLERFKRLTGLDPENSIADAMVSKLVYETTQKMIREEHPQTD